MFKQIKKTSQNVAFAMKHLYKAAPFLFIIIFFLTITITIGDFLLLVLLSDLINGIQKVLSDDISRDALYTKLILFSSLTIANFLIHRIKSAIEERQKLKFNLYIDDIMIKKNKSLDISCFDDANYYDIIELANKNKRNLNFLYYRIIFFIAFLFANIINVSVILYLKKWYHVIIIIIFCIPSFFSTLYYNKSLFNYDIEKQDLLRKTGYFSWVVFSANTAKEMRFFNLFDFFANKYKDHMSEYVRGEKKIVRSKGLFDSLCAVLPLVGVYIVMAFVFFDILQTTRLIGDFIFYLGIYMTIKDKFIAMIKDLAKMSELEFGIERFRDYNSLTPAIANTGEKTLDKIQTIEFKDVYFKYPHSKKYVINNLNIRINADERIGIVGVNGAGKSTLVKLLLRFYDVTSGNIYINGIDIKEYEIGSLRDQFSVVFQDFNIYSLSLRENIAMSRIKDIHIDERIAEALEFTNLTSETINMESLDQDITKSFSAEGIELSGGQRQKLAISRCVFRKAQIVIMDEPTAALDPIAEAKILNDFSRLYQDSGLLMISHRLSNTTQMDRIIVIENGTIIEEGTHKQLMALSKRYSELFNYQASKY